MRKHIAPIQQQPLEHEIRKTQIFSFQKTFKLNFSQSSALLWKLRWRQSRHFKWHNFRFDMIYECWILPQQEGDLLHIIGTNCSKVVQHVDACHTPESTVCFVYQGRWHIQSNCTNLIYFHSEHSVHSVSKIYMSLEFNFHKIKVKNECKIKALDEKMVFVMLLTELFCNY